VVEYEYRDAEYEYEASLKPERLQWSGVTGRVRMVSHLPPPPEPLALSV
jgi:hypothetical protein